MEQVGNAPRHAGEAVRNYYLIYERQGPGRGIVVLHSIQSIGLAIDDDDPALDSVVPLQVGEVSNSEVHVDDGSVADTGGLVERSCRGIVS